MPQLFENAFTHAALGMAPVGLGMSDEVAGRMLKEQRQPGVTEFPR